MADTVHDLLEHLERGTPCPPRERRARSRIPLRLPVRIRTPEGRSHLAGLLNVTSAGAYVVADEPVQAGARVELRLVLPAGGTRDVSDIEILFAACVVRVERLQPGGWGLGCAFEDYAVIGTNGDGCLLGEAGVTV